MAQHDYHHIPVLLNSVINVLQPLEGRTILDGTFGAGGYSRKLLEEGAAKVIAIDRDPSVIPIAQSLKQQYPERFDFVSARFSELVDIIQNMKDIRIDDIVLDIGVSSMQLDQEERGFAFSSSGPLDMRMGNEGHSAADIINNSSVDDLAVIFRKLGEERHARLVARRIVERRAQKKITTTTELAQMIVDIMPVRGKQRIHPATRIFQALRIYVNDELAELATALDGSEQLLQPGGKIAVVTFHSLEDRLVKRFLHDRSITPAQSRHLPFVESIMPTFKLTNRKALLPDDQETECNPRARSAKLRWGVRIDAPPRKSNWYSWGLPNLNKQNNQSRY